MFCLHWNLHSWLVSQAGQVWLLLLGFLHFVLCETWNGCSREDWDRCREGEVNPETDRYSEVVVILTELCVKIVWMQVFPFWLRAAIPCCTSRDGWIRMEIHECQWLLWSELDGFCNDDCQRHFLTFTVLVQLCLMGNFVISICYSLYILAQVDIHCIWRCFALFEIFFYASVCFWASRLRLDFSVVSALILQHFNRAFQQLYFLRFSRAVQFGFKSFFHGSCFTFPGAIFGQWFPASEHSAASIPGGLRRVLSGICISSAQAFAG